MGEVEPQPVGRHQRALLRHVVAEHLAQRLVQQMRRRVVLADARAPRVVDLERQGGTGLEDALLDSPDVGEHVAGLLQGVGNAKPDAVRAQHPGIADLAAGFAVERRLVEHDRAVPRRP